MAHSLLIFPFKNFKFLLFTTAVLIAGYACTTTGETTGENNNRVETNSSVSEEKYSKDQDLTMHLRKINGVRVAGDGPNAVITIRGADVSTFNASTSPLFVIDGQVMNNTYSIIYSMVNRNQIKKIEVLKGADAASYGIRGANGVIIIDLM